MEAVEQSGVQVRSDVQQQLRDAEQCCTELVTLAEIQAEQIAGLRLELELQRTWWRWLGRALLALACVVGGFLSTGCAGAPFESAIFDASPLAGAQSSAGAGAGGSASSLSGGTGGAAAAATAGRPAEATEGGAGGADGAELGGEPTDGGAGGESGAGTIHLPCDTSTWKASAFASSPQSTPALAVDGDELTRWTSGESQEPGQWFELELGAGVVLERLELAAPEAPADVPSSAELELDGAAAPAVATVDAGALVLTLERPTPATRARVLLTSSRPLWWSVAVVRGLCQ